MQDFRGRRGAGIRNEDGLHSYDEGTVARDGAANGGFGKNYSRVVFAKSPFAMQNSEFRMQNDIVFYC